MTLATQLAWDSDSLSVLSHGLTDYSQDKFFPEQKTKIFKGESVGFCSAKLRLSPPKDTGVQPLALFHHLKLV